MTKLDCINDLVPTLRCPTCGIGDLALGDNLVCSSNECERVFPIVDGVPVLIDDGLSIFSIEDFVLQKRTTQDISPSTTKSTIKKLVPSISINLKAKKNFCKFADLLLKSNPHPTVLVIGGSTEGSGINALLSHSEITIVETDVSFGQRTAIVCDAHDIPFKDAMFDGVVAQAVLEHVVDPFRCVAEMHRVLKPNGLVYAETPFMQQVHAGRYDFLRFSHSGHRRLFRDFAEIDSGAVAGPATALTWSIQYFCSSFFKSKTARLAAVGLSSFAFFWLKYLDYLIIDRPAALDAASAFYFLGHRAEAPLSDDELISDYRGAI